MHGLESLYIPCLGECNKRLYNHSFETSSQIIEHIKEEISIKLVGVKMITDDTVNRILCSSWGLSDDMLA